MSFKVYTDGSYCQFDGVSGYGVFCTELELCACGQSTRLGNSTQAEYLAVKIALQRVLDFTGKIESLVILTDLKAIVNDHNATSYRPFRFAHIRDLIAKCSNRNISVSICWVPAHCGIAGNEIADSLATDGRFGHLKTFLPQFRDSVDTLARIWGVQTYRNGIIYDPLAEAKQVLPTPPSTPKVVEATASSSTDSPSEPLVDDGMSEATSVTSDSSADTAEPPEALEAVSSPCSSVLTTGVQIKVCSLEAPSVPPQPPVLACSPYTLTRQKYMGSHDKVDQSVDELAEWCLDLGACIHM